MNAKRIWELREWVYNFHSDANLREVWEKSEWDNYCDLLDLLDELERMRNDDGSFIAHIQSHLKPGQEVICKICGKTAKEITSDSGSSPYDFLRIELAHTTERAKKLEEELLRLRTPLELHHRLDETSALAYREKKGANQFVPEEDGEEMIRAQHPPHREEWSPPVILAERAEKAEAELESARPLIEAVMLTPDTGLEYEADRAVYSEAILRAALAYREKKGGK